MAVPDVGAGYQRLKSALPVTGSGIERLQALFGAVGWPNGLSTEAPPEENGSAG